MYLAVAGLGSMKWNDTNLEKLKIWVDKKNESSAYNKYCICELDAWGWGIYQRNKNLHGCNPTIVYDPYNVGNNVLRCMMPDFNFVRNFGGKSKG